MYRLSWLIVCILSVQRGITQTYELEIEKAGKAYEGKKYDSCSAYFSNAFRLKVASGKDLYNAAVCNAMNNHSRHAFRLLNTAITKGINISKLHIDPAFESLYGSRKWKRLLMKAEKIQADSFKQYLYAAHAARLSKLWEEDQYYRFRLGDAYSNNDTVLANTLWKKMRISDSAVLLKFQTILNEIGWPTKSKVGSRGAATAFLIIDHAPRDVMEKYFPLLETAAKAGEASLSN
jgi:hypothetical protein